MTTAAQERRRYFRINDSLALRVIETDSRALTEGQAQTDGLFGLLDSEDESRITECIDALHERDPSLAELARLLNQKIDRLSRIQILDNQLVSRVAMKVQEVNISACGMGFYYPYQLTEGVQIRLEFDLKPSGERIVTDALVVQCSLKNQSDDDFYCRVDFYGMTAHSQEILIQHVVQSQSAQLKALRKIKR